MGSAFHQLCPRYSGTLTTAPTAIRLWDTFTFLHRKRGGAGMGWQGHLPESGTSLSGIDIFVFSESVACLITVLHFVFFIIHENHAKILL